MRREHDFYPTAAWATETLLERVAISGHIVEPCVGAGDIAKVLIAQGSEVSTNDLDGRHPAHEHLDATLESYWRGFLRPIDWVVTNPPFSKAHEILPLARRSARLGVAMLLRLTYLEPCKGRAGWLVANPPHKLIVLPRISFTGDGKTDNVTCAWFVWMPQWLIRGPIIEIVPPPALQPGQMFDGAERTL